MTVLLLKKAGPAVKREFAFVFVTKDRNGIASMSGPRALCDLLLKASLYLITRFTARFYYDFMMLNFVTAFYSTLTEY